MTTTLIKDGQVYDASTHTLVNTNVLIEDSTIRALGPDLDQAEREIDARGLIITPGLIDLHCHIFDHSLFRHSWLKADSIGVEKGVTALLDTGSAGPALIDAFREFVVDTQQTHCFALCNIGSPGQPGIQGGHTSRPELISLAGTVKAIERNPTWVLGVKVLASSSHTGLMGIEAVKIGRKAAELTNTPLMVHIGNAPPVIDEILELLRPGDIMTHAYHGKVGGVLGYNRKVIPAFREAVDRGIVVDIAHGRSSFSFDTCAAALDQGMPIHSISSDLHGGNINRYVQSLARTMSKFLTLGLSIEDVIRATTLTPARAVRLDSRGFGKLEAGCPANLSMLRLTDDEVDLLDSEGQIKKSNGWIQPVGCFVRGQMHETTGEI